MRKIRATVALAATVTGFGAPALAAADILPGTALSPGELPPEAQGYERLLHAHSAADPPTGNGDTVAGRRHFDDQIFHAGIATGFGTPVGMLGAFVEANPWDAVGLGLGGGVTLWGPAGGAYLRLRPLVWGGQGQRVLHAFTLQTSYTYMRDGELELMSCIEACPSRVRFLNRTAQFGALSAGFEHQLASGWTFRYDFGVAHSWLATPWKCVRYDTVAASPCSSNPPSDTLFVGTFGLSHAL